ncbi:hypothetical protein GO755_16400 [Spirosoma sp. HMF4905]|uniref:Uncharacterized protein n=1 Tax=Spirosoma arboris TaxID=2682092 RepID=A0A7K1SCU9_9BACT|nr:hypothetical protein [Spirosoma arboris]MVM31629.1 hypothetical protein [Spirosoma arboris]
MISKTELVPITHETAIELIGQVIAHYTGLCEQEKKQPFPDLASIVQWEIQVYNLQQEQRACRLLSTRSLMIKKVHTVYFPFLKNLNKYA